LKLNSFEDIYRNMKTCLKGIIYPLDNLVSRMDQN